MNHFKPDNPSLNLTSTTSFGQITGQSNSPRSLLFGLASTVDGNYNLSNRRD
jgi:hypothetical protein